MSTYIQVWSDGACFLGLQFFYLKKLECDPHEEGEKVGSSNGHQLERFFWHIAWLVPTTVGDPKVEMLKLFWEHRINSKHPRKHFAFRVEKPFIINIYKIGFINQKSPMKTLVPCFKAAI